MQCRYKLSTVCKNKKFCRNWQKKNPNANAANSADSATRSSKTGHIRYPSTPRSKRDRWSIQQTDRYKEKPCAQTRKILIIQFKNRLSGFFLWKQPQNFCVSTQTWLITPFIRLATDDDNRDAAALLLVKIVVAVILVAVAAMSEELLGLGKFDIYPPPVHYSVAHNVRGGQ